MLRIRISIKQVTRIYLNHIQLVNPIFMNLISIDTG